MSQALRMMLSVLPRRHADDVSGELFVAAYERQLGHYPAEQILFICDHAIAKCKWFPTVAECHEIAEEWRRNDDAMKRKAAARSALWRDRNARQVERPVEPLELPPITQAAVDAMPPTLVKIGLTMGTLVQDVDGNVRPAPDAA